MPYLMHMASTQRPSAPPSISKDSQWRNPSHFDSSDLDSSADESTQSAMGYKHPSQQEMYPPRSQSRMGGSLPLEDMAELPALQASNGILETDDTLEPVLEDDPKSYDLVQPAQAIETEGYSLEKRSQALFSRDHLQVIFANPSQLLRFTSFLTIHRPQSIPLLVHYLDALKALRAIHYANAICEGLDPIDGLEFSQKKVENFMSTELETRATTAFDALVKVELPAFITHHYIKIVSQSISSRITGILAPHLREASEGLAEVFCLTDPSRPDNPIVFASEEFNRTTQYGMSYILGRNCRFLQGPWTNPLSVRRLQECIAAGRQHQEVFLNYRRDGSPFMNLLMIAPLSDSRGTIRYFIGAQVDVSGLVKDFSSLPSLNTLTDLQETGSPVPNPHKPDPAKNDELRELSEMLNQAELSTIRTFGGKMHQEASDDRDSVLGRDQPPRLLLRDPSALTPPLSGISGMLGGIYQHYLLVRPYPSLRILFASPSQRIPGILQSPFMSKIGGSNRVRDELTAALAEGRGVTAKVRWVTNSSKNANGAPMDEKDGRNKWIHCTPLIGSTGQIGVWMVVIVDVERDMRRMGMGGYQEGYPRTAGYGRQAPPVPPTPDRARSRAQSGRGRGEGWDVGGAYEMLQNGGSQAGGSRSGSAAGRRSARNGTYGNGNVNGNGEDGRGSAAAGGYGGYSHQGVENGHGHGHPYGNGLRRPGSSGQMSGAQSVTSLRID
jgi:hypothetical protein